MQLNLLLFQNTVFSFTWKDYNATSCHEPSALQVTCFIIPYILFFMFTHPVATIFRSIYHISKHLMYSNNLLHIAMAIMAIVLPPALALSTKMQTYLNRLQLNKETELHTSWLLRTIYRAGGMSSQLVRPKLTLRTIQLNVWVANNYMNIEILFYLLYYNIITLKC